MSSSSTTRRTRVGVRARRVLLVGAIGFLAIVALRQPSLDRTWDEDVRVLTGVEENPNGVLRLTQVRDWIYAEPQIVSKAYMPVDYDPADLEGLWLYEQELGLGGRIAHTFLVFQFSQEYDGARWLGISVETRREIGETYSLVRGLLRGFELTHIWATERDLVRRRVEYLDYPLTRYRVDVPVEYVRHVFRQMVSETNALATTPRWYNTVLTNCTSSLITYVNEAEPGAIPRHYSSVLTGRADDHLARLNYLDQGSVQYITKAWLAANPLR